MLTKLNPKKVRFQGRSFNIEIWRQIAEQAGVAIKPQITIPIRDQLHLNLRIPIENQVLGQAYRIVRTQVFQVFNVFYL